MSVHFENTTGGRADHFSTTNLTNKLYPAATCNIPEVCVNRLAAERAENEMLRFIKHNLAAISCNY